MHIATSHCLLFFLLPFSGHWLSAQQGMVLLRSVREGFRRPFWIGFTCCLLYCVTEYLDLEFTYKGQGFVSYSPWSLEPQGLKATSDQDLCTTSSYGKRNLGNSQRGLESQRAKLIFFRKPLLTLTILTWIHLQKLSLYDLIISCISQGSLKASSANVWVRSAFIRLATQCCPGNNNGWTHAAGLRA